MFRRRDARSHLHIAVVVEVVEGIVSRTWVELGVRIWVEPGFEVREPSKTGLNLG